MKPKNLTIPFLLLPLAAGAYECSLRAAACDVSSGDPRSAAVVAYTVTNDDGSSNRCSATVIARANGALARPLLLTGAHCLPGVAGDVVQLTLHFQGLGQCTPEASMLAVDAVGTAATMRGRILTRAVAPASQRADFALIELDGQVPEGVYFSSWRAVQPAVGARVESIGHSSGLQQSRVVGTLRAADPAPVDASTADLDADLDANTTRPGGSGGALYNAAGELIGALRGGSCFVGNQETGVAGSAGIAAESIARNISRYRPFLDPENTGVVSAAGYFAPAPVATSLAGESLQQAVRLTWSSSEATSCTASGAWTGTRATSGSETVSASAPGAYTLTCTDGQRTDAKSVTVTPAAAPPPPAPTPTPTPSPSPTASAGGGGGGALGLLTLLPLLGARLRRR